MRLSISVSGSWFRRDALSVPANAPLPSVVRFPNPACALLLSVTVNRLTRNSPSKLKRSGKHMAVISQVRIALAEDVPGNRKVIVRLLERLGHEVVCAVSNGAELVDECSEKNVDVVFTDLDMPVMDGLAAAQELAEKVSARLGHDVRSPISVACSQLVRGGGGCCVQPLCGEILRAGR